MPGPEEDAGPPIPDGPVLVLLESGDDPSIHQRLSAHAIRTHPPSLLFELERWERRLIGGTATAFPLRPISAPPPGADYFVLAESGNGWISRWSLDGQRLSSTPWNGATTVFAVNDGFYYAFDGVGWLHTYDGTRGGRYSNMHGVDIAPDEARGVFWMAGENLMRGSIDDLESGEIIAGPTRSIDLAPDGSVWAIPISDNPLDRFVVHYDPSGTELARFELPYHARGLRVHPGTGDVWVTHGQASRIDTAGVVHHLPLDLDVGWFSIAPDDETTGAWISTQDGGVIALIDVDGAVQEIIEGRISGFAYRYIALVVPG